MANAMKYFTSTVGRKYLMAITGLAWSGFVLSHMLGNLLIFVGPEAYNMYGHAIVSNPLVYVAEIGLLLTLLAHVPVGIGLFLRNRRTKPNKYAVAPKGAKSSSVSSRTMAYTGSVVLAFIILHVATFKYGTFYSVNYNGVEVRDLYRLMEEVFAQPGYIVWYMVSLVFLGSHLYHGLTSSFQSLGINHPRYNPMLRMIGTLYAVVVAAGFISQPLYFWFVR